MPITTVGGEQTIGCVPSRWTFAAMGFLSVAFTYILRVDINLALVGMVNHTALEIIATDQFRQRNGIHGLNTTSDFGKYALRSAASDLGTVCIAEDFDDLFSISATGGFGGLEPENGTIFDDDTGRTSTKTIDGPFVWEETTQTVVMSSFFLGYVWTQLFGGRLAEGCGGKNVIGFALMSASVMHFLVPIAAATHLYWLILLRILTGLSLGFVVPTINVMVSKWCPPDERSRMNTVVHSGAVFGTLVAMPVTGVILEFLGWQAVFYVIGACAVVLDIAWLNVVHESPGIHPSISRLELKTIEDAIGKQRLATKLPVPWRRMMKSGPLWALVLSVFFLSWGFSIVIALLPTYLHNILHFSVYENGLISALPYVCQFIASWPVGVAADHARKQNIVSITKLRKICHVVAQVGGGLMMMMIVRAGCDRTAVVYILAAYGIMQGFTLSAYSANMLDIAPNFTGTITGTALIGYSVVSIIGPITAGAIISGQETLERWSIIFYVAAACFWASALVFVLLASGEEQPWNRPEEESSLIHASTKFIWSEPTANNNDVAYKKAFFTNSARLIGLSGSPDGTYQQFGSGTSRYGSTGQLTITYS